jgi:hypothetical protein
MTDLELTIAYQSGYTAQLRQSKHQTDALKRLQPQTYVSHKKYHAEKRFRVRLVSPKDDFLL